jgi:membrane-associated phospholipid phosphatase
MLDKLLSTEKLGIKIAIILLIFNIIQTLVGFNYGSDVIFGTAFGLTIASVLVRFGYE